MNKKMLWLVVFLAAGWLRGQEIAPLKGDLNNDGAVNATDAILLTHYLADNLNTLLTGGDLCAVDSIVGVLRYVPAGTFTQGSPPGEPCQKSNETQFSHTLTKNLAVMETEVTRQMWASLRAAQPTLPADPTNVTFGSGVNNPVQFTTWYEAVLFANLLSVQQGLTRCYYKDAAFAAPVDATNYTTDDFYCDWDADGYRLPSEGEWEMFCRAETTTPFWIVEPNYTAGNCDSWITTPGTWPVLESAAWFCANVYDPSGNNTTKPAGTKAPNPWNLKDVHGNVWEWCWDRYSDYPAGSQQDYTGPLSGTDRVFRGAGWLSIASYCRSAGRYGRGPDYRISTLGFRLVRIQR